MDHDRWLKENADKLLASVNVAVKEFEGEFDQTLHDAIPELRRTIEADDRAPATKLAYKLSGSAGSMGWPLMSEVARWLRQVLEADEGPCLTQVTDVLIRALEVLLQEHCKGEGPNGQVLIRETYQMLQKSGYRPA